MKLICLARRPHAKSYLRADKIIDIALKCGADAIHPGYGFLAEREAFAAACMDAGITFIGPKPSAIAAMGDKMDCPPHSHDRGCTGCAWN